MKAKVTAGRMVGAAGVVLILVLGCGKGRLSASRPASAFRLPPRRGRASARWRAARGRRSRGLAALRDRRYDRVGRDRARVSDVEGGALVGVAGGTEAGSVEGVREAAARAVGHGLDLDLVLARARGGAVGQQVVTLR